MSGVATIQPYGFLVALSADWRVRAASSNLADFVKTPAQDALGQPFDQLVGGEAVHALRNRLALLRDPAGEAHMLRYALRPDSPPLDIAMRLAGNGVVIEARPNGEREPPDVVGTVRAAVGRLPPAGDMVQLLEEAVRQLRAMTGFDAISAYRSSGERLACSARGSSALADGDAPPAAVRLICERDAAPVTIIGDLADPPRAALRSPDSGERQAMQRCEAQALLTLPLRIGGSDWGVIACRHHLARPMTIERQSGAELFAEIVALHIAARR